MMKEQIGESSGCQTSAFERMQHVLRFSTCFVQTCGAAVTSLFLLRVFTAAAVAKASMGTLLRSAARGGFCFVFLKEKVN
jgi:hypothetical protein